MPFSLLLVIYLLFAFISHDKFEIFPLLICSTVGLICGYFDYSRYLVNKNTAPIVCMLTIVLFGSIFILDLDFKVLLIIVGFSALCMGAIASMLFHSTAALEKNEDESRKLNEELIKSNVVLREEKDSLHITLSENKKREAELKAVMDKNVQSISELDHKNNELSAKNVHLKINLEKISSEKKRTEDKLLSLARNTSLMEVSFRETTQLRQQLDKKKEILVHREQELNKKIKQQLAKHTDDTEAITKKLSDELYINRQELVRNEREKASNAKKLENAKLSLAEQALDKRKLEDKVSAILREQKALTTSTEELRTEKDGIQNLLHVLETETAALREENQKNKQKIEELSLTNQDLRIKDDFSKKWLEIETLLIDHADHSKSPAVLINYYCNIGKIDSCLQEDLHIVRRKRNKKSHSLGVEIYEHDVKKANECYARLKICLV